jgi:hypothetical protein
MPAYLVDSERVRRHPHHGADRTESPPNGIGGGVHRGLHQSIRDWFARALGCTAGQLVPR